MTGYRSNELSVYWFQFLGCFEYTVLLNAASIITANEQTLLLKDLLAGLFLYSYEAEFIQGLLNKVNRKVQEEPQAEVAANS